MKYRVVDTKGNDLGETVQVTSRKTALNDFREQFGLMEGARYRTEWHDMFIDVYQCGTDQEESRLLYTMELVTEG